MMPRHHLLTAAPALAAGLLFAGCATLAPPDVPAAIKPAPGEVLFAEALATGVQVYECAAGPDGSGAPEWTFRAPEATLADRAGRPLGRHGAGPIWEALDGSTVVGTVKARDPGPSATAIPWLLLTAKTTTGTGLFAQTSSIQRVATVGGLPPSEPCGPAQVGQSARVPYAATYYFYRAPV